MKTFSKSALENTLESNSRTEMWIDFIDSIRAKNIAEIGVYKGEFAAELLGNCQSIEQYYMIDPWRQLDNWDKPANLTDNVFEKFLLETKAKTDFAASKRVVLRGKTTEVVEEIPDGELDFAYIDGDHTLKGISTDLIRLYPKIRPGGWIGGDDFSPTIWQHSTNYEPTLVFPYAVYFAEAVGACIHALPHEQFLMEKTEDRTFSFIDHTNLYGDVNLRNQFLPQKGIKLAIEEKIFGSIKFMRQQLKI